MQEGLFEENNNYVRPIHDPPLPNFNTAEQREDKLLDYVLGHAKQNDPMDMVEKIDTFCSENWMMNLGPEKGNIIKKEVLDKFKPKRILELGFYCAYSSTFFVGCLPQVEIHSIDISQKFASYGRKIIKHAGIENQIHVHIGTVESLAEEIKKEGPYDMVFIDHEKVRYLPDLKLLESYGVIKKDCLVVCDNLLREGAEEHLKYSQTCQDYHHTLFNTFLAYTDEADAVLVSRKL